MSERYFAKIVATPSKYLVVINKGAEHGVEPGQKFLIVGLGDLITDPDTGEELGKLEMLRGKVTAVHVQEKISTLESCEYEKASDIKEITKVTSAGGLSILGSQNTITESIKPGEQYLKALNQVAVGDCAIKL